MRRCAVLNAAGYRVAIARPASGDGERTRPLCCGRTYLAAGLVDEARTKRDGWSLRSRRTWPAGRAIVGLEPSCLLSLRDEYLVLRPR